jgi:hypothetical protein
MDDLLDNPPIHLTPMPDADRARYEALRKRSFGSLSAAELLEYRELHQRSVDEDWEAWGPRVSGFRVPPLRRPPGRPGGISRDRFDDIVAVAGNYPGDLPPTQEQVAAAVGLTDEAAVRLILRERGWNWKAFLAIHWRAESRRGS